MSANLIFPFLLLFNIIITIFIPQLSLANHAGHEEYYHEQLIIRSVNRGQVATYFQFKTFVPTNLDIPFGG